MMDTETCTKLETWEEDHKTEKGSERQRWKKETERERQREQTSIKLKVKESGFATCHHYGASVAI